MRVTSKGQVTIPIELREALGIGEGTEVEFVRHRDTIVVRKAPGKPSRGEGLVERLHLLTRDAARYRTYFPTIAITAP